MIISVMVESGEETAFLNYGQEIVEGLAVNWVDKSLFYAISSAGMITEVDIKARNSTTLVTSLQQPRELVFFSDLNRMCVNYYT